MCVYLLFTDLMTLFDGNLEYQNGLGRTKACVIEFKVHWMAWGKVVGTFC